MTKVRSVVGCGGALCLLIAALSAPAARPATTQSAKHRRGEILRLDKDSITSMPMRPPRDSERDEPKTYHIDKDTRIFINIMTDGHTNAQGRIERTYNTKPGTRDDLKVGLRAQVSAEGDTAKSITVWPDDAAKK